jgi:sulfoxide reductase heme-binding subunit YedZ
MTRPLPNRDWRDTLRLPSAGAVKAIKISLFLAALLPLAKLVAGVLLDRLGANPVEFIQRSTGNWALLFLMFTLSITPARRLLDAPWLVRLRRMLGLYAYFYAVLHLSTYVVLDQFFDFGEILRDVAKRPFITLGFTAFLMMTPLALTSTNAMVRRLGGKAWTRLHKLVYPLAVLGVVHFWLLVKRDLTEPSLFAMALALLLGFRVLYAVRQRTRAALSPKGVPQGIR